MNIVRHMEIASSKDSAVGIAIPTYFKAYNDVKRAKPLNPYLPLPPPVSLKRSRRKSFAFTLAETLVTLGIISVVAAFTISSIQKASWEMQQKTLFKKSISTLNNATLQMRANLGVFYDCYYSDNGTGRHDSQCSSFWTELKQNLNIVKSCDNNSYSNGCIPYYNDVTISNCSGFSQTLIQNSNKSFVLQDGTIVMVYQAGYPIIAVDINGMRKPNKWGHDVFLLYWYGNSDYLKILPSGCTMVPEDNGKTTTQMYEDAFK